VEIKFVTKGFVETIWLAVAVITFEWFHAMISPQAPETGTH